MMDRPWSVGFQPGAIFAVTRETIPPHPNDLYNYMLEELFLGEMKAGDPETGHYFERYWPAVLRHAEYCCWVVGGVQRPGAISEGEVA